MNRRHFAQIATRRRWPARRRLSSLPRPASFPSQDWFGTRCNGAAVHARKPRLPIRRRGSWARSGWPGHLPGVPKGPGDYCHHAGDYAGSVGRGAGLATASAPVPSVAAGPEIFNVTPGPGRRKPGLEQQSVARNGRHARLLTVAHQNLPGLKLRRSRCSPPFRGDGNDRPPGGREGPRRNGPGDPAGPASRRGPTYRRAPPMAKGLDNDEGSTRHSQSLRARYGHEGSPGSPSVPGKVEGELEFRHRRRTSARRC